MPLASLFLSIGKDVIQLCQQATPFGATIGAQDAVLWEGSLAPFLADLVAAGGSWKALSPVVWSITRGMLSGSAVERITREFPLAQVGYGLIPEVMAHGEGLFEVSLGDNCAAVWSGHQFHPDPRARVQVLLVMAQDRDAALRLLRQVAGQRAKPRLRLWGGGHSSASPSPIEESEVVIDSAMRTALLCELDRFWQHAARARAEGLTARRGLLLVGPPGTGKTQLIRHLITRYPEVDAHLFVPGRQHQPSDTFGEMLAHVRFAKNSAMVIIEDIDRIEASGSVTAGYLLNCLDGLLESPVPTLWVATSNDPTRLDTNLLNRPGRFDRTIVFELPNLELREALISLHLGEAMTGSCLRTAAEAAAGLSGAHIREACIASRLAVIEKGGAPEDLLIGEVNRVRQQQRKAQGLAQSLARGQAGFHIRT